MTKREKMLRYQLRLDRRYGRLPTWSSVCAANRNRLVESAKRNPEGEAAYKLATVWSRD